MLSLKVNLKKYPPTSIKLIAGFLKKGSVLVLPTDTIYGFSCLANNAKAIQKIKSLKKISKDKPLSILISDLTMLKKYIYLSNEQEKNLKKIWAKKNRPTTVIFKNRRKLPPILTGKSDGLAVRLPKLEFLTKIIKEVNCPLVSTSLNLSGQGLISNPKDIIKHFPTRSNQPDLVVNAGVCRRHKASKILDLRENSQSLILRK